MISLGEIEKIKTKVLDEILLFKFNTHQLSEEGTLNPEEFCKSIISNLVPAEASSKLKKLDALLKSGKIKGDMTFGDFVVINRFFNEYKKYIKIKKTSNFSRQKFHSVFKEFSKDFDLEIENWQSIDNLFSIIDFDGSENLDYNELKRFLFRLNTGGRSEHKSEKSGFKPWYDFKEKMEIYKEKATEIYDILKR